MSTVQEAPKTETATDSSATYRYYRVKVDQDAQTRSAIDEELGLFGRNPKTSLAGFTALGTLGGAGAMHHYHNHGINDTVMEEAAT